MDDNGAGAADEVRVISASRNLAMRKNDGTGSKNRSEDRDRDVRLGVDLDRAGSTDEGRDGSPRLGRGADYGAMASIERLSASNDGRLGVEDNGTGAANERRNGTPRLSRWADYRAVTAVKRLGASIDNRLGVENDGTGSTNERRVIVGRGIGEELAVVGEVGPGLNGGSRLNHRTVALGRMKNDRAGTTDEVRASGTRLACRGVQDDGAGTANEGWAITPDVDDG